MPRGRRAAEPTGRVSRSNSIDAHVGARVRLRRTLLGLSQEKLGHALGLTFQQVQKYERGANRIGASRLFDLSRVLDVPVSFFFDDMTGQLPPPNRKLSQGLAETPASYQTGPAFEGDPMARRETLELVRAYYKINEAPVRKRLFELTKSLAKSSLGKS